MAERKPTGFRFRLPWLLQPAPTPTPEPPTQPPRASPQTSVASTSAQRPPFRPPGRAPAPAATPAPASPAQARPQPVASPPTPPPVPAKSPVPKSSPIAKTVEPEATQPNKETQTTTGTIPAIETKGPTTPPQRSAVRSPRQAQSQPSPPQSPSPPNPDSQSSSPSRTPPRAKSPSLSPSRIAAQSRPGPQTPPPPKPDSQHSSPLRIRTPRQANYQPSSPSRMASQPQVSPPQSPQPTKPDSQPSSPSSISTSSEANSEPSSPSRTAIQPHVPTKPSSPAHEAIRSRATTHPLSPIHAQPSQARTPPRSPPRSPSRPMSKISLSSPHAKTISSPIPDDAPEIRQSTKITQKYNPLDSNYVPQSHDLSHHAKPAKTRSMNTHSVETKPNNITAARVPLHREIKGDISKFIHNITSTHAQSKDDKHASVITLAGDNTGASMNLSSDATKRGNNPTTDKTEHDAVNNGDQETKAIVNSNIQGSNNSMMFNSSVTERNPGVHLRITRNLANTYDSNMKSTESMEMQRAEVNVTPPHNLVYDPTTVESLEEVYMDPKEFEQGDHERSANEIEVI